MNENFDKADGDLHRAVAELSKAVQSITGGAGSVFLTKEEVGLDATTYSLNYRRGRGEAHELWAFRLPGKGYPIEAYLGLELTDGKPTRLNSAQSVTEFFQKMVSDQSSELVSLIAFTLRNKPAQADADNPPF